MEKLGVVLWVTEMSFYRFNGSFFFLDYRPAKQRHVLLDLRPFLVSAPRSPGFFLVLTHSSSSSTKSPSHTPSPVPIITGAAGAGLISNGASMIHISGVAVAFTALGALVALL